jgi:hypothetical protein
LTNLLLDGGARGASSKDFSTFVDDVRKDNLGFTVEIS